MVERPYQYVGTVFRIVDGDTYKVDIDLGFKVHVLVTVRLLSSTGGVDTPETRGATREAGLRSMIYVERLIPPGTEIGLTTQHDKQDGFERWLARVTLPDGRDLGDTLLSLGLATVWSK